MARPFGQDDHSEKKNSPQNKYSPEESNLPSRSEEEMSERSSECHSRNQNPDASASCVTNVYCVSNSNQVNCGPAFYSVIKKEYKECDHVTKLKVENDENSRKIKVRKGVLTSNRSITYEDIRIVADIIQEDWKKLLKKLPGVTINNLNFHQTFINAMDRKDSTNMAEIALSTWKTVLPEFSTIGNLSKTLFNIGHPDVVTYLKP